MSVTSDNAIRAELRQKWGWFLALGLLLLAFGLIAAANLLIATVASVFWVGIMMIAGGVLAIFHAFSVRTWGSTILGVLAGLLYAVAGIFVFVNPAVATAAITITVGLLLVVVGLVRLVIGLQERTTEGWGWVVIGGLITALAGVVIVAGWPGNSIWVLGIFLVVDLLTQGVTYTALALSLKKAA